MKVVNLVVILFMQTTISGITGHEIALDEDATSCTIDDDNLLKSSNAAIENIQSEDGDLIGCIDIYKKSSAFSHPALKDHKIQMKPSYVQTIDINSQMKKKKKKSVNGMGSGDYAFPDGRASGEVRRIQRLLLTNLTLLIVFINTSEQQSHGAPTSHISKTIQSEYGDVIDCIPIDNQPAFIHPALTNHTIQMRPSNIDQIKGETTEREGSIPISLTMWQRNGRCPQGTIPIRRSKTDKAHNQNKKTTMGENDKNLLQFNHSLAVLIAQGFAYYGAKGDIKVCYPQVEHDDDYSASQVTLVTGPYRNYEAIKSGWTVNPGVYGDRQTRLFVYWTVDGSVNTGCFDHTCPGFVQTNTDILLGSPLSPILPSNSHGPPPTPVITIFIQKDPVTSNWWVHYNEEVSIGYWPAELFSGLRYHAESVQWGGEVYSSRVGVHPGHTATHMACGRFANPWPYSRSGFVKRMRVQQNAELVSPVFVNSYADEYRCYNTLYLGDYVEDPELYYGGPGRNPTCP